MSVSDTVSVQLIECLLASDTGSVQLKECLWLSGTGSVPSQAANCQTNCDCH
jgi:hypothetical protein